MNGSTRISAAILALAMTSAAPAQAGHTVKIYGADHSGVTVSYDHGIAVYRAAPTIDLDYIQMTVAEDERAAARTEQARQVAAAQARAAKAQAEVLAMQQAQAARLTKLENDARRPRRRNGRFIGNPAFFGPNGFLGNSNFDADPDIPAISPIRYNRRIFD